MFKEKLHKWIISLIIHILLSLSGHSSAIVRDEQGRLMKVCTYFIKSKHFEIELIPTDRDTAVKCVYSSMHHYASGPREFDAKDIEQFEKMQRSLTYSGRRVRADDSREASTGDQLRERG